MKKAEILKEQREKIQKLTKLLKREKEILLVMKRTLI
jgi:hypothetical protein